MSESWITWKVFCISTRVNESAEQNQIFLTIPSRTHKKYRILQLYSTHSKFRLRSTWSKPSALMNGSVAPPQPQLHAKIACLIYNSSEKPVAPLVSLAERNRINLNAKQALTHHQHNSASVKSGEERNCAQKETLADDAGCLLVCVREWRFCRGAETPSSSPLRRRPAENPRKRNLTFGNDDEGLAAWPARERASERIFIWLAPPHL